MTDSQEPVEGPPLRESKWVQLVSLFCYLWQVLGRSYRQAPPWVQVLIPFVVVGVVVLLTTSGHLDLAPLRSSASQLGNWFPLVFFLIYVVATLFPIPRTVFTLSAGILFPVPLAIILCLSAATLSAMIAFLVTRYLAYDWVTEHLHHPLLDAMNERLRMRGWLAVGSLRLIPFVPFSLLNYAAALTPVRLLPFLLATLVGSTPGTTAGILLGEAAVGSGNPTMLIVTCCCLATGVVGLILDSKLPVTTTLTR